MYRTKFTHVFALIAAFSFLMLGNASARHLIHPIPYPLDTPSAIGKSPIDVDDDTGHSMSE